jgi:hypothetical protein
MHVVHILSKLIDIKKPHGTEPFLEIILHWNSKGIPYLLWKPKVPYCVHKNLPFDHILNKVNEVCTHTHFVFKILLHFEYSISVLVFHVVSSVPTFCTHFLFSMCAACLTHLICLYLITIIGFSEEYKLWNHSSFFCPVSRYFHLPVLRHFQFVFS